MSSGKIVQIIGAVVDVEFDVDSVPKVYDALTIDETERNFRNCRWCIGGLTPFISVEVLT